MSLLTTGLLGGENNFRPVPFIPPEASLLFFSTHFTDKSKGAICTTQSKGIVRTCVAISYDLVASESDCNIWLVDFGGTQKKRHEQWQSLQRRTHLLKMFKKLHCFPLVSSKLKVVSSNFEDFAVCLCHLASKPSPDGKPTECLPDSESVRSVGTVRNRISNGWLQKFPLDIRNGMYFRNADRFITGARVSAHLFLLSFSFGQWVASFPNEPNATVQKDSQLQSFASALIVMATFDPLPALQVMPSATSRF